MRLGGSMQERFFSCSMRALTQWMGVRGHEWVRIIRLVDCGCEPVNDKIVHGPKGLDRET